MKKIISMVVTSIVMFSTASFANNSLLEENKSIISRPVNSSIFMDDLLLGSEKPSTAITPAKPTEQKEALTAGDDAISTIINVVATIAAEMKPEKIFKASNNVKLAIQNELQNCEEQGQEMSSLRTVLTHMKHGFLESFKFTWDLASIVAQKHGAAIAKTFVTFLFAAASAL